MGDQQVARLWDAVDGLRRERVTYRAATVTAVDPIAGTFDAEVEGAGLLAGIPAPLLRPRVGDVVQLDLFGATPVYRPNRVGEGTIGRPELDEVVSGDISAAGETAQQAAADAAQAVADAEIALTSANGKNAVTFSPDPASASVPGKRAGDIWWQRNAAGVVIGTWEWDGDSWEPRKLGDAVLDTLSAAKIVTGQLGAGVSVHVGDPGGDHVLVAGSGLVAAYAADQVDGVPNLVSRLGRDVGVWDPATGQLVGLLDQRGHLSVQSASIAGGVRIGGTLLSETLWMLPKGIVGNGQRIFNPGISVTGEEPLFDTAITIDRRRTYRFHVYNFDHSINNGGSGNNLVYLRVSYDGASPTITSPLVTQWQRTIVNGNGQSFSGTFDWVADVAFEGLPTSQRTRTARFQFSFGRAGNTGTSAFLLGGPTILIEDLGPNRASITTPNPGGQGFGSTAPVVTTPVKQRHVMERVATWSRSFTPTNGIRDDPNVYQGYSAATGGDMAGMWGFADMTAELTGAQIERIDVYLYATHWHSMAGGTAIINTHAQLNEPATWSKYETDPDIRIAGWPRAEGRWVGLDLARYAPRLQDGRFRGVTVGRSGGSDLEFYGRFHGAGEMHPARIRVEYVK